MSRIELFKHFVKNPGEIGAICPSSSYLSNAIVSEIGVEKADAILEIGPGTGVFTEKIIERKRTEANFFAIELNEALSKVLKERFSDLSVHNNCASELQDIMRLEKVDSIDVVVSGLPWASFPESVQDSILDAVIESLSPGGYFATFAYLQGFLLKGAHRFRAKLKSKFSSVTTSKIVWRNLPPAFVYRCVK
ncbi:MAG: methyltransferase domain-containing protein [Victivallales bacterium]|nr:methyltransferase domain-containing protein [Victivallales bacterium]